MSRLNSKINTYLDKCRNRQGQDGVVMVIVPIIMVLVGLLIAYMTRSINGPDFYKEQATRERMDEIANAVSAYVHRYNRLPCPARPDVAPINAPYGYEDGSGLNGGNIPAACPITTGIVPFKTLGLSLEYGKDAWHKYFTYAVSPAFTTPPTVLRYDGTVSILNNTDRLPRADTAPNMAVHAACRTSNPDSWVELGRTTFNGKNGVTYTISGGPVALAVNPFKARFCCAGLNPSGTATDLQVVVNGAAATPTRDNTAGDYATADVNAGAVLPVAGGRNIETVALVLISHGANGSGAYMVNGTLNREATPAASFGLNEIENSDNDTQFIDNPRTLGETPASYFDDIVLHFTQNQLYGRLGNVDCTTPY